MLIDSSRFNGPCSCGREHHMLTKEAVIEAGCLRRLDDLAEKYGLNGKRAVIYDRNTYHATRDRHPKAECEIILDPRGLHADEHAVEAVRSQLPEHTDYLIAVGSGTIHDITRYCARLLGIDFISCPTAASVDGFCSTVSAMTWKGYKKTLPGVPPAFVLADLDIIKRAPLRLALSGAQDIFGKYTALTDWRIAHALTGEYLCPVIEKITEDAVKNVHSCCLGLGKGDDEAFEQLTYALILSGLAMQLMGNSRPASGSEHHISHLIEMEPQGLGVHSDALHGEKVGVGTILVSKKLHQLAEKDDISSLVHPYAFLPSEEVMNFFGSRLYPSIKEENKDDCMSSVTPEMLIQAWSKIRRIISAIPDPKELYDLYDSMGAKKSLSDIEVNSDRLSQLLRYAPCVRNRLTFMRASWMLGK